MTPCYDTKGLAHCECGKEPWETKNYCNYRRLWDRDISTPLLKTDWQIARAALLEELKGE